MDVFDFCSGLILFFIIIFGIVGNALSFIVWTKGRRCKKLPGGIYLRALAVSDTTALLIPAMNEAISLLSSVNPKHEISFICKLEIVGRHFGLLVSSWIIVFFTVERTIAIFRPTVSTGLISKTATITLMVIIFIVNLMMNFPFGVVYDIAEKTTTQSFGSTLDTNYSARPENESLETETVVTKRICTADRSNFFNYLNWYHIWFMDWFLIFIIPFALITGSNLTVLYLVVSRKNTSQTKLGSKVKGVTMRAVTISIMHCVTTGPFSISVLIPGYFSRALSVKYSQEYYINRVCLVLAFLNHAINFVLYSFFGSEFRRDCADIIWKKSSAVHPDGQTTPRPNGFTGEDKSVNGDSRANNEDMTNTGKTHESTISSVTKC